MTNTPEANRDTKSDGGVEGHAPEGSTSAAASGLPERRPQDLEAVGWQREAETGRSSEMARVREQASNCVGQDSDRIAGPTAARGGAGIKPGPSDTPEASLAVAEASEQIVWRRVNSEPFEYAIQQGPHGDEFVKLLNGTCLRRAIPTDTLAGERGIVQPSIATKPTSSRAEASATETDDRRIEHLRVQALGAALSRRDWSAAERAYEAIRDAFDMLPANAETDARNRSESTPPAVLAAPQPPVEGLREALEFYADPFAWKAKHDPEDIVRIPDFYSETSFGDKAADALAASALQRDNGPWRPIRNPGNGPQEWGIETADKGAAANGDEVILHPTRGLSRERVQFICDSFNARIDAPLASPSLTAGDQKATSDLDVHADVAEALTQACEYFENRADVNDGDYGVPEPNTEMRLAQMCSDALERLPALDLQGPGKMDSEDRSTHEA